MPESRPAPIRAPWSLRKRLLVSALCAIPLVGAAALLLMIAPIFMGVPPPRFFLYGLGTVALLGGVGIVRLCVGAWRKWMGLLLIVGAVVLTIMAESSIHQTAIRIYQTYLGASLPVGVRIGHAYHGAWLDPTAELELSFPSVEGFSELARAFAPMDQSTLAEASLEWVVTPWVRPWLERKDITAFHRRVTRSYESDKRSERESFYDEYLLWDKAELRALYVKNYRQYQ